MTGSEVVEEPEQGEFLAAQPSRRLDIGAALGLSAFFAIVLVGSRMLQSSVATEGMTIRSWPTMISVVGLVCSVILLVKSFIGQPEGRGELEASSRQGWRRFLFALVAVALGVLMWWLGLNFIVVTPFLVAAVMWIGGARAVKPLIILPVITTVIIFVLFVLLLKVPL